MKTKQTTPTSVFDWRGPTKINWSGKTERQVLLDATRVNPELNIRTPNDNDKTTKIKRSAI